MGKFTWLHGDTFEGSHLNHDSHGYGTHTFAKNGEIFEGEFRNGRRNGKGKYKFDNGDIFIGNYLQSLNFL